MPKTPPTRIFRTAATLLALLASATLHAQQQDRPGWNDTPPPQQPSLPIENRNTILTLHVGTQLVVQDITVTDAIGHPVTGLKPEDFHISEDGRLQTIKTFEEQSPIDPALAEERAAALSHSLPPNTFTNYKAFSGGTVVVFLLDAVDQAGCGDGAGTQMHLRQDMIDYMKTMPLGTPYIIFQLDTNLRMVQNMTTDREALSTAVRGKRDAPEITPQLGSDDPRYPAWATALRRRQILTAAMKELQRYLGAIPGRKNLVWFTGVLAPSLTLSDPTFQDVALAEAGVPEDGQMFTAGRGPEEMKNNPPFRTFLDDLRDRLAQARIALYPMQGSPVPGASPPICDYPHGKERIAAIVDKGAHYYTLSYTPTNPNWNGQPRRFNVELDNPAYRLDYRKTYTGSSEDKAVQHIATPVETAAATTVLHEVTGQSPTMQVAMGMGTIEPTQVVFEAGATPALAETKDPGAQPAAPGNFLNAKLRKQGYRDYVVHYRVRANELNLVPAPDRKAYTGKLEFVAVVYDNQGHAVNGKREKASISFDGLADPQFQTAELTGDLTVEVPVKGAYFLRLGVRDIATDRIGALEIPIDRIAIPQK